MLNSGTFYLKYFDSQKQGFIESNDYFSFSKFVNPNRFDGFVFSPTEAFSAGLITSGQATGIGMPVIIVSGKPTLPSGPSYSYPIISGVPIIPGGSVPNVVSGSVSINDIINSSNSIGSSHYVTVNGVYYMKVFLWKENSGKFPTATGYYWAVDANPLR
jgi:hypothetical protein